MRRTSAIFIAVCVVLIAASIGAALYLGFNIDAGTSAIVALSALTGMALFNSVSNRLRDRTDLGDQIADLSRYMLKVTDLADGEYAVSMNGKVAARLTAKELAAGWNMSTLAEGVIAERSAAIVELITKLQGPLNTAWRAASKAKDSEKLAECQKAIDACEVQLAAACKPVAIQFAIRPAGK